MVGEMMKKGERDQTLNQFSNQVVKEMMIEANFLPT